MTLSPINFWGFFREKRRVLGICSPKNPVPREIQAVTTIINPDDFTFQFWSHFSGLILKEFREKKEKLDKETAYSQAAYLISFYNLFFKGLKKKKRDMEVVLKTVDIGLRKPPYFFTFSDIMGFRG